jgi:DNA-binding transcriptional LysR family regulator
VTFDDLGKLPDRFHEGGHCLLVLPREPHTGEHRQSDADLRRIEQRDIALDDARLFKQTVLAGRLRIDIPVAFGRRVLLPILIEITRPHPGLTLSLTSTDATSDLFQDDVDLAIRFGTLKDSSHLIARHLVTQERVICAFPDYLRIHGEPWTLEEVRSPRCIVGAPKVRRSSGMFARAGWRSGSRRPRPIN